MEEQEEGRRCENEEEKIRTLIQKKKVMPQTMIPLKNYYGRTVQTADSKFWFACYLYSIDGVPSPPTLNVHSLHLRSQCGKRLDVDPHLICRAFNPKGQREKVGRESHTLLSLPRRERRLAKYREKKKSKGSHEGIQPCIVIDVSSVPSLLVNSPCWFLEVLFEDNALFPPSLSRQIHLKRHPARYRH